MSEIGIGQVERESRVVTPGGRAEQQWAMTPNVQYQAGEVAGAAVVDPLFAEALLADVTAPIENGKRLAVLEDLVVGIGQLRAGLDLVGPLVLVAGLGQQRSSPMW